MINIQFVVHDGRLYIIEANPRASRTVPIIQKATGINLVAAATRIALGEKLRDMEYGTGLLPHIPYVVVKVPVFSFSKMRGVETMLGPEMKSTGEVLGIDETFAGALLKGFVAAGVRLPGTGGRILVSIADEEKEEAVGVLQALRRARAPAGRHAGDARRSRSGGHCKRADQQDRRRVAARPRHYRGARRRSRHQRCERAARNHR